MNEVGKQLNLKLKKKLMVAGSQNEEYNTTIDGKKVKQVEIFKCLGSTKTATACLGDIKSRMIKLQDIWRNLSKDLKVKLVKDL